MPRQAEQRWGPDWFRRLCVHFPLFYALWLLLSGARVDFLIPGVVAALAAAGVSLTIWKRGGRRLRLFAVPRYLLHFLWRSFVGGVDVAWRVFHPRLPVSPEFLSYRCRVSEETQRVLFCDSLSLMPGTLGARLEGGDALIHLLSRAGGEQRRLAQEEEAIARLFSREPPR